MLYIIRIFLFIKVLCFMWILNCQFLFIKNSQICVHLLPVIYQWHTTKNYVWGELLKALCELQLGGKKNLKKLQARFFQRLCNRGFRKDVLTKLFHCVTFAQRNKLLML